jgi:16S rRNA (guanine527-N7)-methyltransferase
MGAAGPGAEVLLVLERSRERGFLGPGPVEGHVAQAQGFRAALGDGFAGLALDLGSGGGVPGLMLAAWHRSSRWLLVDASLRRVRFLEQAVRDLAFSGRVEVRHSRAEDLGRESAWRGRVDAVVARGFGPPAVVAECAAPLLRVGGVLAVSEPPGAEGVRWPAEEVERFGLTMRRVGGRAGYQLAELELERACPSEFPRRSGVPSRSPLF